jgi:hypothetical protein
MEVALDSGNNLSSFLTKYKVLIEFIAFVAAIGTLLNPIFVLLAEKEFSIQSALIQLSPTIVSLGLFVIIVRGVLLRAGGRSLAPLDIPEFIPGLTSDEVRPEDAVTRAVQVSQIIEFLEEDSSKIRILSGSSGVGKSFLIKNFVGRRLESTGIHPVLVNEYDRGLVTKLCNEFSGSDKKNLEEFLLAREPSTPTLEKRSIFFLDQVEQEITDLLAYRRKTPFDMVLRKLARLPNSIIVLIVRKETYYDTLMYIRNKFNYTAASIFLPGLQYNQLFDKSDDPENFSSAQMEALLSRSLGNKENKGQVVSQILTEMSKRKNEILPIELQLCAIAAFNNVIGSNSDCSKPIRYEDPDEVFGYIADRIMLATANKELQRDCCVFLANLMRMGAGAISVRTLAVALHASIDDTCQVLAPLISSTIVIKDGKEGRAEHTDVITAHSVVQLRHAFFADRILESKNHRPRDTTQRSLELYAQQIVRRERDATAFRGAIPYGIKFGNLLAADYAFGIFIFGAILRICWAGAWFWQIEGDAFKPIIGFAWERSLYYFPIAAAQAAWLYYLRKMCRMFLRQVVVTRFGRNVAEFHTILGCLLGVINFWIPQYWALFISIVGFIFVAHIYFIGRSLKNDVDAAEMLQKFGRKSMVNMFVTGVIAGCLPLWLLYWPAVSAATPTSTVLWEQYYLVNSLIGAGMLVFLFQLQDAQWTDAAIVEKVSLVDRAPPSQATG